MIEALVVVLLDGPEQFSFALEGIERRYRQPLLIEARFYNYAEACRGACTLVVLPQRSFGLEHKLRQTAIHRDPHHAVLSRAPGCDQRSFRVQYPRSVRAEARKI